MTRPGGCPECPARPGAVTRVFRDIAPAVLWISLASGQVFGVTEGHEVWTQQAGWTSACQLSVGDAFVDAAGEPVEIVEIVFDPTPTTVYNLEVDGAFTYFAEGVWVHNRSDCLWSEQRWNKIAGEAYQTWVSGLYGYARNNKKLPSGHIPDIWDPSRGIIGDIKDRSEIDLTQQLETIGKYAQDNGLRAILIVSESKNPIIAPGVRKYFEIMLGP